MSKVWEDDGSVRTQTQNLTHSALPLRTQTLAFLQVMSKFGILEVARTGRIALKRGEELLEDAAVMGASAGDDGSSDRGLRRKASFRMPQAAAAAGGGEGGGADVYAVDENTKGVWEVRVHRSCVRVDICFVGWVGGGWIREEGLRTRTCAFHWPACPSSVVPTLLTS